MPEVARRVFAVERLPLMEAYAARLADDGVVRGLIGPRELPRLWDRHLVNCGLLHRAIESGASVADVGTGAGLPGLVLGIARPDLEVTLIEPLLRRTTFLEEVVAELGLDNVGVHRGRAESLHERRRFDVVTSRAVAPLERLADWCMPLVAPEGRMLALKGLSAESEVASCSAVLVRKGAAMPEVATIDEAGAESITVVSVRWASRSAIVWGARSRSGSTPRRPR